jgi:microcystin-dependent protein
MSYQTASNQSIIENVLYSNNLTDGDKTYNPASIGYVNAQVEKVDLTSQLATITSLQNQLNILITKSARIIGSILTTSLLTAPQNYMLCNGASISTSEYPELFSLLGYTYGGSGTSFNIPSFRSFYPVGANNTQNNLPYSNLMTGNNYLNSTSNYLLSGSVSNFPNFFRMAPHTHDIIDNGHSHTLYTNTQTPTSIPNLNYNIKQSGSSYLSSNSTTGITIISDGVQFQQVDPLSGLKGVNSTPPFIAYNFYICVN